MAGAGDAAAMADRTGDRRRQRPARLRELLVRDRAAAGARVLRAGTRRLSVRSLLVDADRFAAHAAERGGRARVERRLACRPRLDADARALALQEPRRRRRGGAAEGAADV